MPHRPTIQVACGVLINAQGEVLLAQRPAGKIAEGYWEFPGGKIEPGESPLQALSRELVEEIGIQLTTARPLLRFSHSYSNRHIVLDTWLVSAWQGQAQGLEGQALAWHHPAQLAQQQPLLPTVLPIAAALNLPQHYVFTPATSPLATLLAQCPQLPTGALLRLRQPGLAAAQYRSHAAALLAAGVALTLDLPPTEAAALGASGIHLNSRTLAEHGEGYAAQALALGLHCFASCHSAADLALARAAGCTAAVLSPVCPTASHPHAPALGWNAFHALASDANLPVYALGGIGPAQLATAQAHYGQGVAGISAYWC